MCGGYRLEADPEALAAAFAVDHIQLELPWPVELYPGTRAPVVLERLTGDDDAHARYLGALTWGLIPHGARDPSIGQRLFNARAETLAVKPSFRDAFARRRCLVPVQAFFEWSGERGHKQKHAFYLPSRALLSLAGIWDVWLAPDGTRRGTFSVVTTDANPSVAPVHDRMPLIVGAHAFDGWLAVGVDAGELLETLIAETAALTLEHQPVPR